MLLEAFLGACVFALGVKEIDNSAGLERGFVESSLVVVIQGSEPIGFFLESQSQIQSGLEFFGRDGKRILVLCDRGIAVAGAFQRLAAEIVIGPIRRIQFLGTL